MKSIPVLHLLLCVVFLYVTTVYATCYNPDGSAMTNPAFQPCNQVVSAVSMCCGTNWTGGKVAPDVCYPNGLCLNNDMGQPLFWRGSCTDSTWKSPNCLSNLCTTYAENGDPTTNVALTDCGDGSWCCQGGNTTCCKEGLGIKIAATIGVSSTIATALSAQSTPSISSSGAASTSDVAQPAQSTSRSNEPSTTNLHASVTNSPEAGSSTSSPSANLSPQSGGLDTGTKIGIALSIILAAVLIAAAIGFWIYRKKRRHYSVRTAANPWDMKAPELPATDSPRELPEKKGPARFQYEMQGDTPPPVELAAERYSRGFLGRASRYASQ